MRPLLFPLETLIHGLPYGWLQYLIRSPKPLDAEYVWRELSVKAPPAIDWVCQNWPLRPLRPLLLQAKMKQDHVLGIAAHYDVSKRPVLRFVPFETPVWSASQQCADRESG